MGKDIGQDEGVSSEQGMGVAADAAALAPSGLSPSGSQAEPAAANAGHTPLPWDYERDLDPRDLLRPWVGQLVSNRFSAMACGTDLDEATANAAFIVRACNSHYELLEALTDPDLSEAVYRWSNEKNIGRQEYDRRSAKVEKMRAAIAKATGQ